MLFVRSIRHMVHFKMRKPVGRSNSGLVVNRSAPPYIYISTAQCVELVDIFLFNFATVIHDARERTILIAP